MDFFNLLIAIGLSVFCGRIYLAKADFVEILPINPTELVDISVRLSPPISKDLPIKK